MTRNSTLGRPGRVTSCTALSRNPRATAPQMNASELNATFSPATALRVLANPMTVIASR